MDKTVEILKVVTVGDHCECGCHLDEVTYNFMGEIKSFYYCPDCSEIEDHFHPDMYII